MTVTMLPASGIEEALLLSDLVTLKQAGFQDGYDAMRDVDKENVKQLVEASGDELPALLTVRVVLNGGMVKHAVIDGYHRWQAAIDRGDATIKAIAHTYETENAVIMEAFEANFKHGLKASKQTRTDYALWIWKNDVNNEWSMRMIAHVTGLNVSTVSRAVKKYQEQNDTSEAANRTEADTTKKMLTALHKFCDSTDNAQGRAKAIYNCIASQPEKKHPQMVQELRSLNETLNAFIHMLNAS